MKHIDVELELRMKLGVTIHKNMTPAEIVAQWGKVPVPIRNLYPEVDLAITTMGGAAILYETATSLYGTLTSAYKAQKEILEVGSAALYAPTLPAVKASEVAQVAVLYGEEVALNAAVNFTIEKLTELLTP